MAIQTIQYLADKLMNADDAKALAESIGSVSETQKGTNAYTVAPNNDEFERFLVERNRTNNEPTSISLFPAEDLTLGTLKKHLSGYKESPPKRPGASRQATFRGGWQALSRAYLRRCG